MRPTPVGITGHDSSRVLLQSLREGVMWVGEGQNHVNIGMGDIYHCTHLFTIFKEKNIKLLKNCFQSEKNQVVKKIVC